MPFVNIPHTLLREKTEETVKGFLNTDRDRERFPIVSSATGTGKSFIQNNNIPEWVDRYLPDIKLILRLSPTRDVAADGTYVTSRS